MARIAGVDIPRDKRVVISLTYIFGIGNTSSEKILESTNINPSKRVKDLDEAELTRLRDFIDRYRGMRHRRNLPARGQRTRTNARTRRGVRRTVAGKKKAPRK